MKKVCFRILPGTIIIMLLLTSICFSSNEVDDPVPTKSPTDAIMYGDLDYSNVVDSTDFTIMKRHLLKIAILTGDALKSADVDANGFVDSTDYTLLKRFILRIIDRFPADNTPYPTPDPTPTYTIIPSVQPTTPPPIPVYRDVSVHDPSVIKTNGTYYVIGSHLAFAKTNDLIQWQQINSSVRTGNPLIPNVYDELKESFDWAQTTTMWAGDIIRLQDGKYYMYYCLCKGDSPRSTLGLAVSDNIEGPYKDLGILLKSGMWGEISEDGTVYDATIHPNAIDPDTFFDKDGNLWMTYGSYSGGIFILKMDTKTGRPYVGQGYGKKLLGANHSRIEAPYMLYSPKSDYYYLFLSYGGLDANGGYNIRVARSKNPDGPFYDAAGNNMIDCRGPRGSFFDDRAIEPYGVKLFGNFRFIESGTGYVSPGHNSAYYDAQKDKYYMFFHTRFPGQGEMHQVRVHQMFINEQGWPVVAPHRYAGEIIGRYSQEEVSGNYAYVNHGSEITANIKDSVKLSLNDNGTISGNVNGTWQLIGDNNIKLTINGVAYSGIVLKQWDNSLRRYVMTFSALSVNSNVAVWGTHQ